MTHNLRKMPAGWVSLPKRMACILDRWFKMHWRCLNEWIIVAVLEQNPIQAMGQEFWWPCQILSFKKKPNVPLFNCCKKDTMQWACCFCQQINCGRFKCKTKSSRISKAGVFMLFGREMSLMIIINADQVRKKSCHLFCNCLSKNRLMLHRDVLLKINYIDCVVNWKRLIQQMNVRSVVYQVKRLSIRGCFMPIK